MISFIFVNVVNVALELVQFDPQILVILNLMVFLATFLIFFHIQKCILSKPSNHQIRLLQIKIRFLSIPQFHNINQPKQPYLKPCPILIKMSFVKVVLLKYHQLRIIDPKNSIELDLFITVDSINSKLFIILNSTSNHRYSALKLVDLYLFVHYVVFQF